MAAPMKQLASLKVDKMLRKHIWSGVLSACHGCRRTVSTTMLPTQICTDRMYVCASRQSPRFQLSPLRTLSLDKKCHNVGALSVGPVRTFVSVSKLGTRSVQDHALQSVTPQLITFRRMTSDEKDKFRSKTTLLYISALGVFMVGMSYLAVPLYRIFCQTTGRGGQAVQGHDTSKIETMTPVKERVLQIKFNADTASSMQWNFKPQQTSIQVVPGETALAFYSAKNPTDKPIIGISTYNIIPFEAGAYFNKIQCFCFEEQRLNPNEEVDLPVFFYIDPDYVDDPKLENVDRITLSYTFFEAREGLQLPYPGYATSQPQPA